MAANRFGILPRLVRAYIILTYLLCGVLVLVQVLAGTGAPGAAAGLTAARLWPVALFAALMYVGERTKLRLNEHTVQGLGTPAYVASILLFPPPWPLLSALLALTALYSTPTTTPLSNGERQVSPLYRRAFNVARFGVNVGLTSLAYSALVVPGIALGPARLAASLPAVALVVVLTYGLDTGGHLLLLALRTRVSLVAAWRASMHRFIVLTELAAGGIGVGIALAWLYQPIVLLMFLLPVIVLYYALQNTQKWRRRAEQMEAVLAAGQGLSLRRSAAEVLVPTATAALTIGGPETVVTAYQLDADRPDLLQRVLVLPPAAPLSGPMHIPRPPCPSTGRNLPVEVVNRQVALPLAVTTADGATVVEGLLLLDRVATVVGSEDADALRLLALQAGIALENLRLHDRALARASDDLLTGLLTHRAAQSRLDEEVARARHTGGDLTVVLVNIDHFTALNAAHGLLVGDGLLRAVAANLRRHKRPIDIAARYAGDEFLLILPALSYDQARALAAGLVRLCGQITAPDGVRLSVRAGVAALGRHGETRDEVLHAAGQATAAARGKGAGEERVGLPEESLLLLQNDPSALSAALEHANLATVRALAEAVDAKDAYTRGHSQRVAAYAHALATALALPAADLERVRRAGILHDVGKIGVRDAVLTKPGPLTKEEFEEIKAHPEIGERMLAGVPYLRDILPAVRHHHEQWGGLGYPDRLAGGAIPADAAILAVADAYDAMTSSRTYRPALPHEEACRRVREGSGTQFAPHVVAAFNRAVANGSFLAEARAPRREGERGASGAPAASDAANVLPFPSPPLAAAGRAGSARASVGERGRG